MNEINFDLPHGRKAQVNRIAKRYADLVKAAGIKTTILHHQMDLTACHNHGCALDFDRLEKADDFNLAHDVGGIHRNLNRETGELENCFRPRFAEKHI